MSGKMMWIELSWAYYTYTMYVCVFVYLYSFRNVITYSPCIVCVWILWWFWILCSWEQMTKWISLRNIISEDVGIQCSDMMWHWDMNFYIIFIMFWRCYFMFFRCLTCFSFVEKKFDGLVLDRKYVLYPYLISF